MHLLWLKLKAQRYLLTLLLVVVALQLVMAQASSQVLAQRQPPLSLAVQQLADDPLSHQLVADLGGIQSFEVIMVDTTQSPQTVFRQQRVQALLVIPPDFGIDNDNNQRTKVVLYPAPGITNSDFAAEQVASTIMQLRARQDLISALKNLGSEVSVQDELVSSDLLEVVYEGPALQTSPLTVPPVFGVSALLVLIAFLHAALTVPTRQDKRVVMRGRTAYVRQFCASLLAVWLVWLVIIALYFAFTAALIGSMPDMLTCLGFVAIMFYGSLLAALLAQLMGRHGASWVFLPLFMLSMTIGGGLWANATVSPLLAPVVPVAAVVVPGSATLWGTGMLFGAGALICGILLVMFKFAGAYSGASGGTHGGANGGVSGGTHPYRKGSAGDFIA